MEAFTFKGFALIDVLQPCVAWNRNQTYEFYGERVYKLEETDHDTEDLAKAYEKAHEWGDKIPIGVLYRKERSVYRENFSFLEGEPLAKRSLDNIDISELLKEFS
jgi:2-oxoglutarate ferredoxin oxidoreductase subunit beta